MTVVERAAYVKGLVDGTMQDRPDYKVMAAFCELLADMAHEIEDLQSISLEHAGVLDEMTDELITIDGMLQDVGFDFHDDELTDDELEELGALLDDDGEKGRIIQLPETAEHYEDLLDSILDDEQDDSQPDEVFYDITCPSCGRDLTIDEDTLSSGTMNCPFCGEILEFDVEDED